MTAELDNLTGRSRASDVVPLALFLAGLYSLPTSRARNLYVASWFAIVGGILTIHTDYSPGYSNRGWWNNYTPTVWSYLLWGIGIWCIVALVREVRLWKLDRRIYLAGLQEEAAEAELLAELDERDALVRSLEEPEEAPPITTVNHFYTTTQEPAPAAPPATEAPEPSKLIIPSFPGQGRRVRREGETLSGLPIADRRAVDPSAL